MIARLGWLGDAEVLKNFLETAGADRDESGDFKYYPEGTGPMSFMGAGQEYTVAGELEYSVGGVRYNLAAGLNETCRGLSCVVL